MVFGRPGLSKNEIIYSETESENKLYVVSRDLGVVRSKLNAGIVFFFRSCRILAVSDLLCQTERLKKNNSIFLHLVSIAFRINMASSRCIIMYYAIQCYNRTN